MARGVDARGEERRRGKWRYVLLVFEETGVFGLFYDEKHALFSDPSLVVGVRAVIFPRGSAHVPCGGGRAGRAGRENSGLDFA